MLAGQRRRPAEAIHDGIIPANLGLAEAELMLGGKMGRELTLRRRWARSRDDYDLILIDCPPALGLLTVNALVASDYALLSAEAQYFALQGVEQALEVIELARDSLNPDLEWLGVVLNIADMRTRHSREAFDSLREHFGEQLFQHDDPRRRSPTPSPPSGRVSILDYRPDLAVDYLDVGRGAAAPARPRGRPAAARVDGAGRRGRSRQRLDRAGTRTGGTARGRRRPGSRTAPAAPRPPAARRERLDHQAPVCS